MALHRVEVLDETWLLSEPTALNTSYNDGKNNKVGSLKAKGGAAFKGTGIKVDPGSTHSGSYNDGKNNKVGNLKTNQSAFEQ